MGCRTNGLSSEYKGGKRKGTNFSLTMTRTDLEVHLKEMFPRIGAFKLCRKAHNTNKLVDLPTNLVPAGFKKELQYSGLYIVPFELDSLELPAQFRRGIDADV